MTTTIDPAQPAAVADALLPYLASRLDVPGLAYAEPLVAIGRGMDTHIYGFRLAGERLTASCVGPLVLRVYPSAGQDAKAEREFAVQRFAAAHGYPAVAPLAVELSAGPLGLPFMVMSRAAGETLLDRLTGNPLSALRLMALQASAHADLHELPVEGCPLPSDGPLVARQLARLRGQTPAAMTDAMRAALAWLDENRQVVEEETPALCHGDFHPLNLLVSDAGAVTVLDWSDACVGDRHFDVARSLVIFWLAPYAATSTFERLVLRSVRGLLAGRYLAAYKKRLPIETDRIRYWKAFHACTLWMQAAALHAGEGQQMGAREGVAQEVPQSLPGELEGYVWRQTRG